MFTICISERFKKQAKQRRVIFELVSFSNSSESVGKWYFFLFLSISHSIFGCEKHHVEMRVISLFELINNVKWYLGAEVLSKMSV